MSKEKVLDALSIYKNANFRVFTRPGLILSLLLIIIFVSLHFLEINLGGLNFNPGPVDIALNLVLIVISALFTSSMFWLIGKNYGPRLGNLLVSNKILKIVLTKGDTHYFEKLGETERKITPALAINKFINLLLSWLAITAFLIGFFVPLIGSFLNQSAQASISSFLTATLDRDPLFYVVKVFLVLIISPILLNIVIPIPWMLNDTQLKSYASAPRINFLVGRLVQQRVASIFAIGGIVSLILVDNPNLNFYFALLGFILLFIGLPASLVAFLYNLLFQLEYYDQFIKIIPVPLGITKVDMESKDAFFSNNSSSNKDEGESSKENSTDNLKDNEADNYANEED